MIGLVKTKGGLKWAAEAGPEALGIPSLVAPNLLRHWKRVLRRSRGLLESLPKADGPTVLFISTLGRKLGWPARAAILAYALRLRGARPVLLTCDKWLEACEEGSAMAFTPEEFVRDGPRKICASCFETQSALFNLLGFPHFHFSQFHTENGAAAVREFLNGCSEENLFDLEYRGIPLGPHIESSILRFFLRNTRPVGAEYAAALGLVKRYAQSALFLVEACERALDEIRPDVLVVHYGCYISRGVPPAVANSRNVRVAMLCSGYQRHAWTVGLGANIVLELADRKHGPWESLEWTSARERRLLAMLEERIYGGVRSAPKDPLRDKVEVLRQLQLVPDRPLLTMFSNLGWDSKSFYDTKLYPNVEDWVFDTIEIFAEHPSIQLVIRVHPAETLEPGRQSFENVIKARFPSLPPNVRIVPPHSPLSSYTLGELSTACIVYGSTIGLELATLGKPIIVTGRAPYWRKGFTYDVLSRGDYVAYLKHLEKLAQPDPERVLAARRFAYYLFFMREIPFPYWYRHGLDGEPSGRPWWQKFRSLLDLLPGRDPNLDAMCDSILTGSEAIAAESDEHGVV